jgi:hypothetical protein
MSPYNRNRRSAVLAALLLRPRRYGQVQQTEEAQLRLQWICELGGANDIAPIVTSIIQ